MADIKVFRIDGEAVSELLRLARIYIPGFLIRLTRGANLFRDMKGYEPEQDRAKESAARRWVDTVNDCGGFVVGSSEFAGNRGAGES